MTIAGSVAGTGRLLAVGLSHKTAPIEDREKAALDDRLARPVLRALGDHPAVSEAVVLSTCNRTELYAVVQDPGAGETALRGALREHTRIDTGRLECALYTLHEEKVAAHLFRVASGLDSMVVGESEIQGQVRAPPSSRQKNGCWVPCLPASIATRLPPASAFGARHASEPEPSPFPRSRSTSPARRSTASTAAWRS